MKTLPIVLSPDPTLRTVCEECTPGDPALIPLAQQMAATMYENYGCGIAAPQVGVLKRLVVIDCNPPEAEADPIFLVNPVIVDLQGDPVREEEGCLSCPGVSVPITRQPYAKVEFYDLEGNKCSIEGDGLWGRCFQHEIDHLNGKTLFESCSPADRLKALSQYKTALARGAKPGDTE